MRVDCWITPVAAFAVVLRISSRLLPHNRGRPCSRAQLLWAAVRDRPFGSSSSSGMEGTAVTAVAVRGGRGGGGFPSGGAVQRGPGGAFFPDGNSDEVGGNSGSTAIYGRADGWVVRNRCSGQVTVLITG